MIAVVIPCYRTKAFILPLLAQIGQDVDRIYVVDDACPERTGLYVKECCCDPRLTVIFHAENQGVGGAVLSGYVKAIDDGATVIVKLDGDGQMDPSLLPKFVIPILNGKADYVKGNRFFDLQLLESMPLIRLIGNAALSFISKACTGYWDIMDPTNGYTAVHAKILRMLPLHKIDKRYFFESDLLFRLSIVRAVVCDMPMKAKYEDEVSSLRINRVLAEFPGKYVNRFFKRIFYSYFLRDFNVGSVELLVGLFLMTIGALFGIYHWYTSNQTGIPATSGTVMLASLPIILGFQSLLAAVSYDVCNVPKRPVHLVLD
ncbi:glycosyltransferase family 2 protein [Leptolyngbya sp. FACHB-36]|uniref:glycosyltransferase family 2 protein n=1 Tax=Leptolyngbya sp. FACHB-36 TaxID=2692808 RepID=UPI0016803AA6|nr:glycosyltransferase family 2 protein [Leptolyngbya sp. FACHB-36]MBD2021111.1 glycosyltransferase family 2 protein [Leptolyngbya sp. FACHB-36]